MGKSRILSDELRRKLEGLLRVMLALNWAAASRARVRGGYIKTTLPLTLEPPIH